MNEGRPGQYGPAYEVVSRRWDSPLHEMIEAYVFTNGWAVEVVTNLSNGVVDASSSVRLLVHEPAGIFTVGQPVSDQHVPPAPDPESASVWFTDAGTTPDWLSLDGLRVLCAGVAALPAPVPDLGGCEWFAMCERDATHMEKHPAFPGGVPACDECASIGK